MYFFISFLLHFSKKKITKFASIEKKPIL